MNMYDVCVVCVYYVYVVCVCMSADMYVHREASELFPSIAYHDYYSNK